MQFKHKSGMISVEVIKDSYNEVFDSRITTLILEYPRLIHSEFKTHRVFSSNASSSRAIPVSKMVEQVRNNPAMPVHWGKNQAGMTSKEELTQPSKIRVQSLWKESADSAASIAESMQDELAHKQVINRILEPYQFIRVCLTSTNFANWFYLRNSTDADPTIHALAETMQEAMQESKARKLFEGHWHVPFVDDYIDFTGEQIFKDESGEVISLQEALIISASCAAQTSYRKLDTSLEKAKDIYSKLIESKPCHSSPVEHSALVIAKKEDEPYDYFAIEGVTHIDKNAVPWSGNFHGYIQYRQLIKDNAVYN